MSKIFSPLFLLLCVCALASPYITVSAENQCATEEDLNFESCDLKDLPITALEAICDRLGLNVEEHMFPYMFEDDDVDESEGENSAELTTNVERPKEDYVEAALQCLTIEEEMERMLEEDPEALEELERQLMAEDPSLLAEIVADVLAESPDLIKELEDELRKEDPILFQEIIDELGEGQTLADRPEILAEIVYIMLDEDPDLLERLDQELDALIGEESEANEMQSEL